MISSEESVSRSMSDEHKRAMRWLASLAAVAEPTMGLQHALEFYSLFAQTGDSEYLQRCEAFLKAELREARP